MSIKILLYVHFLNSQQIDHRFQSIIKLSRLKVRKRKAYCFSFHVELTFQGNLFMTEIRYLHSKGALVDQIVVSKVKRSWVQLLLSLIFFKRTCQSNFNPVLWGSDQVQRWSDWALTGLFQNSLAISKKQRQPLVQIYQFGWWRLCSKILTKAKI